jgi:hypothetical protein
MADFLQEINERIKALGGEWGKYSLVGSFFLYAVGYLALRFHLSVLGVGTDLSVLDERYLFTGARFLVYLVTTVPIIVFFLLPAAVVFAVLKSFLPPSFLDRVRGFVLRPGRLTIFGIVFSTLMIQCVMAKCFVFYGLLLKPKLPTDGGWLTPLLLGEDETGMNLYFALLIAAATFTLSIVVLLKRAPAKEAPGGFLKGLLVCLASVQLLMLPVNFGMLVADLSLPRVSSLGDRPLAASEEAWLAWEGKEGVTFLVRNRALERRSLITLARSNVKRLEILEYNKIVRALFVK